MKLIKVLAKVCLVSEEQMEAEATYDLGNIAKDKQWVWRKLGMGVYDIYRIQEYSSKMSVIITEEDEKILVKEPFDELFERWQDLKKDEPEPIPTDENVYGDDASEEIGDEDNEEDDE